MARPTQGLRLLEQGLQTIQRLVIQRQVADQHSAGTATQGTEAIVKSRGGNTTKIHLAVDTYGLPLEFMITGGEVNDCTVAPELITKLESAAAVIADKGYEEGQW